MSNLLLFPESPRRREAPDAQVRAEALDIRRSFIVQAPAGSGKTTLLIQRFLKLLADESVAEPEQVLAITFTNAATAELRDRVLRVLARVSTLHRDSGQPGVVASLAAAQSQIAQPQEAGEFDEQTLDFARDVAARDAQLGWELLAHPHRLRIRTIDSVCAEIARSLPVLSGSGGALAPSEDAAALYHEAARRTLLLLGSGDPAFDSALRELLLHRDGNLSNCEALIAEMLALRDQWGELVPLQERELDDAWLDTTLLPRLERTLDRAICSTLEELDRLFPSDLLHELASLAASLGQLPGTLGGPSPIACCAGLSDPPEAVAAHLDRWRALIHLLVAPSTGDWRKPGGLVRSHLRFEYDRKHPHHAQLAGILDRLSGRDELLAAAKDALALPPARYPADQWQVAKSLFRVLSRALVELQIVFAERGQCDFAELGLLARSTLRSGSGADDLASALGARLQHLLVDEMQDTSAGQYELLELLTASWDGHSQTVFLVGDPYQSIYLFRQARMERFLHSLETCRLGELPLTRLVLTANFRSQAGLVHQFNEDFSRIFSPRVEGGAASSARGFIHASPALPPASSAAGRVWQLHPKHRDRSSDNARRLVRTQADRDADSIARIAADWLRRPLLTGRERPWRIAVLVRSRLHLAEIVPALRRNAVPFRAIDIESLRDRQEVLDLTALTRALLHPADRVAGLAILRAPWCGLPLADLHTLAGADDAALRELPVLRLIEERAHLLPGDSRQRVARVASVLRSAAVDRARQSIAQQVERAWRSLGGDAPLAPAELTNARRFFEVLDSIEAAAGRADANLLDRRLAQLYAEPGPLAPDAGCIELLTIHKAKGLEWDVVLVPALERQPARNSSRLLTWSVLHDAPADGDAEQHAMLAPIAARGEESGALTRWLRSRQNARERAENKRLFYVACTRAAQELHLFGEPALSTGGSSPGHPDSLLAAAWPAAEVHAMAATQTVAAGSEIAQSVSFAAVDRVDSPQEFDIAAQGEPEPLEDLRLGDQTTDDHLLPPAFPVIARLPSAFDPAARFAVVRDRCLPYGDVESISNGSQFTRPEGSFAARSFGNAVHACLELLTARIAAGITPAQLLAELPAWSPRIIALLRADGLPAAMVSRLARETRAALENMLRDPDGQWLLAARPGAASEFSLTAASGAGSSTISMRVDRVFRAGPKPHAPGDTHLWIIDYKTGSRGGTHLDAFLSEQRAAYSPQLEAYARILAPAHSCAQENVRLALYFPALADPPRLLWWALGTQAEPETADGIQLQLTLEN